VKVGKEWSPFFDNDDKLTFVPTLDMAVLGHDDIHVQHCSDEANSNRCNDVHSGHPNAWDVVSQFIVHVHPLFLDRSSTGCGPGQSICATHKAGFGTDGDDDSDVYRVDLKNGWTVLRTEWDTPPFDNGTVTLINDFNQGTSSSKLTAHYAIGATGGEVGYSASVFVIGPKGLPK
jgi:hypothetical protein